MARRLDGTGAGDHLLRGLATFAVLAAIAFSYARLPASAEPLAAAFAPTLNRRNEPELVLEG